MTQVLVCHIWLEYKTNTDSDYAKNTELIGKMPIIDTENTLCMLTYTDTDINTDYWIIIPKPIIPKPIRNI